MKGYLLLGDPLNEGQHPDPTPQGEIIKVYWDETMIDIVIVVRDDTSETGRFQYWTRDWSWFKIVGR